MSPSSRWTNKSALRLAGDRDPVEVIQHTARTVTMAALDAGISPPVDPFQLADHLGILVVPRPDIRDARTVALPNKGLQIEFNPDRPRTRIRYSIAHELGHSLFPDCREHVRHRATYHELQGDDYQLEALCNVAASEFLMPLGSLSHRRVEGLDIDHVLDLRRQFDVSTEAILIRLSQVLDGSYAMFAAARVEAGSTRGRYRFDYVIPGRQWQHGQPGPALAPADTILSDCTAIGYTVTGLESWWSRSVNFSIHAVGVPPYPGSVFPRVVGFVTSADRPSDRGIRYQQRDASDPPNRDGRPLIAHIVNDKTPRWGNGFAWVVRKRYPAVQREFIGWTSAHPEQFKLGQVHVSDIEGLPLVVHMIAQHGYGLAEKPRIRYGPLEACLGQMAEIAESRQAAIYMPRIGTGQAGGNWDIIEGLVLQQVVARGLAVTVYDPPGSILPQKPPVGPPKRLEPGDKPSTADELKLDLSV